MYQLSIPHSHNLHSTNIEKLREVYSLERRAFKNTATENVIYITTNIIGNRYYSKQITWKFKSA